MYSWFLMQQSQGILFASVEAISLTICLISFESFCQKFKTSKIETLSSSENRQLTNNVISQELLN